MFACGAVAVGMSHMKRWRKRKQHCFDLLGLIKSADTRMEEKPYGHPKQSHTCGIV